MLSLHKIFIGIMSISACSATNIGTIDDENDCYLQSSIHLNGYNDEVDLSELLEKKDISIGHKKYGLVIHTALRTAILNNIISKEDLEGAFESIKMNVQDDEVIGYSLKLYKNKIIVEPFLGDNAK